ncbi:hypothetical protein OEZ85_011198 [Tetradesmus obliquus]|uniref:Uncharacterized protein n=1 Tax=Tetradesmus obliquus TaxID=3088 RepID=A0ABY8TPZ5_TETOB|nr:hypothetical protein OEZ85_011198 [Tetradesmus obliquus]
MRPPRELDELSWRALALHLHDPSAFAASCRRARELVAEDEFRLEWFAIHHRSRMLLHVYVAGSRNTALMQQLLSHRNPNIRNFPGTATGAVFRRGTIGADINASPSIDLACCCAALKAGDADMLRLLFTRSHIADAALSSSSWQRRMMLQYAARHSNAACIQEAVCAVQASMPYPNIVQRAAAAVVMPQHLHMAAARTDPWAEGAVSQLLQALTPKQRKPSNMRPAYKAACSSGCLPVLALLLHEAAKAPHSRAITDEPGTTSQQQQWQQAEEASRLHMADLLWQQLVVQQGKEADLRVYVYTGFIGTKKVQGGKDLWSRATAVGASWLMQHNLPPKQDRTFHGMPPLWSGAYHATRAGDFAAALGFANADKKMPQRLQDELLMRDKVQALLRHSIGGRLRRACAASDAAAVAQLERLAGFASNAFAATELDLNRPLLLRSLLGGFNGRAQALRHNSSDADVARAKAVLAAVATAEELPAGAGRVDQAALMRVLDTGDADLLALFMCWANRVA